MKSTVNIAVHQPNSDSTILHYAIQDSQATLYSSSSLSVSDLVYNAADNSDVHIVQVLFDDDDMMQFYNNYTISADFTDMLDSHGIIPSVFNIYNMQDLMPTPDAYIRVQNLTVLIPDHNISLYDSDAEYIVTAAVYVHGVKIILRSVRLDSDDIRACKPVLIKGVQYHQCFTFLVPYVWDVIYDDTWTLLREELCGEHSGTNEAVSTMQIYITPVKLTTEPRYRLTDSFTGGYTSVSVMTDSSILKTTLTALHTPFCLQASLTYNEVYDSIQEYIAETYPAFCNATVGVRWELVLRDDDDIYVYLTAEDNNDTHSFTPQEINIASWNGYHRSMFFVASAVIMIDGEDWKTVMSNKLSATEDLYSYVIGGLLEINNINLDEVDMTNQNFNVINSIENKIVTIDNPADSKAHIIQPAFFQTQPVDNITIYRGVTANIAIDLNAYKALVKHFTLRIANTDTVETARIANNVIFKVNGALLSEDTTEGTYFIISETGELVTTGKYTVI